VREHTNIETTSAESTVILHQCQTVIGLYAGTKKEAYETIQRRGEHSFFVRLDEKLKELGVH
jgi:hypothetical protein